VETREKDQRDKAAATRQREKAEQERLAQERKLTTEAELEKQQLAAAQRAKEEAARKKEDSLKAIAPSLDNPVAFDKAAIEAELIEIEDKWEASIIQHDPSVAAAYLADDYRGVSSKGKVMSKSSLVTEIKNDTDIYESATNKNVKVQVHSPTMATVMGDSLEKGRSKAGKTFDRRFRWTDTWIKRDGRWQCTASQAVELH
jgi:hypothetical protein